MIIDKHTVVQLSYELYEGNAEGQLVERTEDNAPLTFILGIGQMIPDFEKNLQGLQAGNPFAFGIESQNAYGEYDQDAIVGIPRETFQGNEDLLQIGNLIPMRNEEGHHIQGVIAEVLEDMVVMDFNHPMAGKNLFFKGKILTVRQATPSELQHGHVHGEGGIIH